MEFHQQPLPKCNFKAMVKIRAANKAEIDNAKNNII